MTLPLDVLEHERRALAGIAEVLIPRADGMPSAGDLDLVNRPLDRVLRARPDLALPIKRLAAECGGDPRQAVLSLELRDPQLFEALLQAVLGAYYMDRRVRALISYPGQRALTLPRVGFGAEDDLIVMMSQPPRYRDPDAQANGV